MYHYFREESYHPAKAHIARILVYAEKAAQNIHKHTENVDNAKLRHSDRKKHYQKAQMNCRAAYEHKSVFQRIAYFNVVDIILHVSPYNAHFPHVRNTILIIIS